MENINFSAIAGVVQKKAKCTRDEAFAAIGEAFLTLDKTFNEKQQACYLISTATYNVKREISKKYINGASGEFRFSSSEFDDIADETNENNWDFLNEFQNKIVRDFAENLAIGKCSFTIGSVSRFLRNNYNINDRKTPKAVLNEIKRICATWL